MTTRDTVEVDGIAYTSSQATIWRWRRHFQHDFAARMDWCVANDFEVANHNPWAVSNGDSSKEILRLEASPGDAVTLTSAGSTDPDGDKLSSQWMVYREAGMGAQNVTLSATSGESTQFVLAGSAVPVGADIHVILTLEDNGNPSLVSYRRAIISVVPGRDASESGAKFRVFDNISSYNFVDVF